MTNSQADTDSATPRLTAPRPPTAQDIGTPGFWILGQPSSEFDTYDLPGLLGRPRPIVENRLRGLSDPSVRE